MSSVFESLAQLPEQALAQAFGVGVGIAIAEALRPLGVAESQAAWSIDPSKALDPGTAAQIAAEGLASQGDMAKEASFNGIDSSRFSDLYDLALTAPGFGELLQALRRKTIDDAGFTHGLRKAHLEDRYDAALKDLANQYIGLGDIAVAIVRGAVPAPSWVPVAPPTSTTNVKRYPVVPIDPVELAGKLGFSEEMLQVMVARSGLSMAPGLAARAFFRGILADDDYHLAVAEGDLRTEWADALREVSREIPTPSQFQEGALRGVITNAEADAGSARHGMVPDDAHLLFEIAGRSLAVHQITTGLERGGEYGGTYDDIPEPYRDAVRRSNIRPEYARLAYANRYSIPSYFILKAILTDGGMTEAEFAQYGKDLGWPPDLAEKAAAAIAGTGTAASDPNVVKAQNQLWTATHSSYVDHNTDEAGAKERLTLIGVTPAAQTEILKLWDSERELVRASLTAAEIKKAVGAAPHDTAWGVGRLQELGWDADDAGILLAE